MNLSLFGKIGLIFKYIFSSFLSIEMFIFCLLLFLGLVFNIKRKNKIITFVIIGIYLSILIGLVISCYDYVKLCVDQMMQFIMNYIYFPSTIVYFFIMLIVLGLLFYTIFNKSISRFKKIVNYIFFGVFHCLFMNFIIFTTCLGIDFADKVLLYKNDTILAFVQISNLLLLIWVIFTCFYHLFLYYKKTYD